MLPTTLPPVAGVGMLRGVRELTGLVEGWNIPEHCGWVPTVGEELALPSEE